MPEEPQPRLAWQETAGKYAGLLLSEGLVPQARWGPWFLEAVFLAYEDGRVGLAMAARGHHRWYPVLPGALLFLQEGNCNDSKKEDSIWRARNSQNPTPSEKHRV